MHYINILIRKANKHNITNLSINEFIEKQCINELKCDICKNDEYLYNDKFYICSCKQNICPLCAKSHDQTHIMMEYNDRFNKCIKHNNNFITYCNNCNMNLCDECEKNHKKHKIISFEEKKPNKKILNEIKKEIKEIESKIKQYKMEIQHLNNLYKNNMNTIINDLNKYILFYEKINRSIDNLKKYESIENINYEIIQNLNNIKNIKNINFIKYLNFRV